MKSTRLKVVKAIALAVFSLLVIQSQLAAQDNHENRQKHHHYQLIDMGTFGGPQSFTQDQLQFLTRTGIVAGWADTTTLDPNYPNSCFFCIFGPYIFHAFQWRDDGSVDLGSLPGANSSGAFFVSDSGLSAGFSENGVTDPLLGIPAIHAVFWKDRQITDLGTLEGGYESGGFGVNNHGQVTGFSSNLVPDAFSGIGTQQRTFLWQNGVMQDLGTLGGTDAGLLGDQGNIEINERGQVTACSYTNSIPNPTTRIPTLDPFLWDKKKGMQDLGTLGGTYGCSINLNNRGQVIGYSNLVGDQSDHPFLWSHGVMQDLGTLGGSNGRAIAINDVGEVVGWAMDQSESVLAFLWKNGAMINLGTLSPLPFSNAQWINSKEQIVGFAAPPGFSSHVAFLWENGGPMIDLNTLVSPGSALQLAQALNINDRGEIAGDSLLPNGDHHAFLLIPCDDDHPGIEGCDYSMAESTPEESAAQPVEPDVSRPMVPTVLWRRDNRFHLPRLGSQKVAIPDFTNRN